jgi:site-specific DNA-methyltransferase (adenine-specific)
MRQFPDKFFDLAVVDPPYGINMDGGVIGISRKAKNVQYTKKSWDSDAPDESYFKELQRVSKNQIVFGANHFISRIPLDSSCWIVWNKENGENPFADCELAWTSFKTAVRMFTFRWQGMLQGNMKHKEVRIHPTQKPVALYAWIFKNFSKGGGRKFLIHTWVVAAAELQHLRWGLTFMGVNLIKNTLTKWNRDSNKSVMVLR